MKSMKLIVVSVGSLVVGAAGMLVLSFSNPFASRSATAAITETGADGYVLETFYARAPEDGIAATHDGDPNKPVQAFPQGIPHLNDEHIANGFVLLNKVRNKDGVVVGFASEMEEVGRESNILQGRMIMYSTWTIEIPGRGTLFLYETEDASEFAKKVIIPAMTLGKTWDEPWTFVTTSGPAPDGRGIIIGGTGEFQGVTGMFTEVTHLKRFTPDGQISLEMELQLAYKKPGQGGAA
jgi:hypothetical protein